MLVSNNFGWCWCCWSRDQTLSNKGETEHFWKCSLITYTRSPELKDPCLDVPLCLFQKLLFDRHVLQICFKRYAVVSSPNRLWFDYWNVPAQMRPRDVWNWPLLHYPAKIPAHGSTGTLQSTVSARCKEAWKFAHSPATPTVPGNLYSFLRAPETCLPPTP